MKAVHLRFPRSFYVRHGLIGGLLAFFCFVIVATIRHGGLLIKGVPAVFLGPWLFLVWREYRIAARVVDDEGITRHDGRRFLWKNLRRVNEVRMFVAGAPTGPINNVDIVFGDGFARILVLIMENATEAWQIVRAKQKEHAAGGAEETPKEPAVPTAPVREPEPPQLAASLPCTVCGELGDYHYAMQKHGREDEDTFLPAVGSRLKRIKEIDPEKRPNQTVEQCPGCGAWFLYESSYEFLATGSEEEQWLSRIRQAVGRAGDDPATLAALDDLRGEALFRFGRYSEAESAFRGALGFWKSRPGLEAEALAEANNLATLWLESGKASAAKSVLVEALKSVPEADRPDRIAPWLNLAVAQHRSGEPSAAETTLAKARLLADKALPPAHPLRARIAEAGAALAADANDSAKAAKFAAEASDQALAWLRQIAAFADENALLNFRRTVDPISPRAAFGAGDTVGLLDVVLQSKGAALEQALRLSKWSQQTDAQSAAEWRALTAGRDMRALDAGTRERLDRLRRMGNVAPVPELPKPSAAALIAEILPGTTWVEFVQWKPYAGRGEWDAAGRYGALVLRRDTPPRWIDLAPASEVDARVRRTIASARDTVVGRSGRAGLLFQTGDLWRLLWV